VRKMKKYGMGRIISRHAPGHIREEVLELIDEDLFDDMDHVKRLHYLLGRLWNCTDTVPSAERRIVADFLDTENLDESDSKVRWGCSYAQMARHFRPLLIKELNPSSMGTN
jgi:hypothetical protein